MQMFTESLDLGLLNWKAFVASCEPRDASYQEWVEGPLLLEFSMRQAKMVCIEQKLNGWKEKVWFDCVGEDSVCDIGICSHRKKVHQRKVGIFSGMARMDSGWGHFLPLQGSLQPRPIPALFSWVSGPQMDLRCGPLPRDPPAGTRPPPWARQGSGSSSPAQTSSLQTP